MMSEIHCQPISQPASPETLKVVEAVFAERLRQISQEGWTPQHDGEHKAGELARAAACYAAPDDISWTDNFGRPLDEDGNTRPMSDGEKKRSWSYDRALRWPWAKQWWKPKDRRRDLIRSAALLVAEIERLDRSTASDRTHG
jgi:hypothetical protein